MGNPILPGLVPAALTRIPPAHPKPAPTVSRHFELRPHDGLLLAVASTAAGGLLSVQDYRVNAEVRRLLVSRWVDVSLLQLGTTNGVVYILGHLDSTMEDPNRRNGDSRQTGPAERVLQLAVTLEKDVRRVRDVRDVIFKLDNVVKRGGRWRAADGTIADRMRDRRIQIEFRPTVERVGVDADNENDEAEGGMS